jgi:Sulfatase
MYPWLQNGLKLSWREKKTKFFRRGMLWLSVFVFIGACTWRSAVEPSILVIMVEDLGFNSVSCGEGRDAAASGGFKVFCDESVRFTHAYTPSLMSQATLASLLTAKYPFEHGVRNNGAQSLAGKEETFPERALGKGYRTSFFSGGVPLLRRSGLSQGFEVFDDNINLSIKNIYRNAADVVRTFLTWHDAEVGKNKFLSFLYLNDLLMTDQPTTNELGEVRESSYRSQVDVVDEALGALIKQMKKKKIWDTTHVFLVGLQGAGVGRSNEIPVTNLFSDGTHIALMVKPARKVRDGPFNWKIDANVSLVDLGATFQDIIGEWRGRDGSSVPYSLRSALSGPSPAWAADRFIISESAWLQWKNKGKAENEIRASVRQGPYLYLFDEVPKIFNTFTDNGEHTPLRTRDSSNLLIGSRLSEYLLSKGFRPWQGLSGASYQKMLLARELWHNGIAENRETSKEPYKNLLALSKQYPGDMTLLGWRAIMALRKSNWSELKAVSESKNSTESQRLWGYVARRNLGENPEIPAEPCLSFLSEPHLVSRDCRLEGWSEFLTWSNETLSETARAKAAESFFHSYLAHVLAVKVAEHSLLNSSRYEAAQTLEGPHLFDLLLALPEFKKQRALVRAKIGSELGSAFTE